MQRTIDEAIRNLLGEILANEVIPRLLTEVRAELARASRINPDQLVSAEQAAEILGMSLNATRKAAARGTLPARRIGRRLRFRVGDLMALGRHDERQTS